MVDAVRSWPVVWAWLTLFGIVLVRAGGTYLVGRALASRATRHRRGGRPTGPWVERIERWGPPAVTLSFLTLGVQTVVNLSAGLLRMSGARYLLGLLPGAVIWATLWTTLGVGVIAAATSAGADHGTAVVLLVVLVVVVVAVAAVASRLRRDRVEP